MKRRVVWSPRALANVSDQVAHIFQDNPDAAIRVATRIRETGNALGDFATGHPGRATGIYEKSVRGLPYILAYEFTDNDRTVSILRLIHTARDWNAEGWPE